VVKEKQSPTLPTSVPAELALQTKAKPKIFQDLQRIPAESETSPFVAAMIGSKNPSGRPTIQIGYGKLAASHPDALGRKNAMRVEEPGCLFVKTSVDF
jgi:hypothetical protein